MLRRIAAYATRQGINPEPLLAALGVEVASLAPQGQFFPLATAAAFMQAVGDVLGDPCVGLAIAAGSEPRDYGLVGLLFQHAPTLREAFEILESLYPQFLACSRLVVDVEDGLFTLEHAFDADHPGMDLVHQEALAAFFVQARAAAGGDWPAVRVTLRQRSSSPERFAAVFGVEAELGADADRIVLRAEVLERAQPKADALLLSHLLAAAETQLARRREAAGLQSAMLRLRGCSIDLARGVVHRGSDVVYLTSRERELLQALATRANEVVTHEDLERDVWRIGRAVVTHAPAVAVRRLRQKIEPPDADKPVNLLTVFGEGWKLVVADG